MKTRRLTYAALLVAVGVLLPLITAHGMGLPGNVLLPMHLPVLLAGLSCGPWWGGLCGIISPVLSSLLTGMPAPYPMLPIMACELFAYGFVGGWMMRTPLREKNWGVYPALLTAMLAGRTVYAGVFRLLTVLFGQLQALSVVSAAVQGLPGILVQLLLVPPLAMLLLRGEKSEAAALASAKTLLREGRASCVVMRQGVIVHTEQGRGIRPVLSLFRQGELKNAVVADKIVGKAAALLLVQGGVLACYGETASESARDVFRQNHIRFSYGKLVPYIENRSGNGLCPMEETVAALTDPALAADALEAKIKTLEQKNDTV